MIKPLALFCFYMAFFLLFGTVRGQDITISNITPRIDSDGNIIDAHDGNLMVFNNRFFLYGAAYGKTNGFTKANFLQAYSSANLKLWNKIGPLLKDAPPGIYYRPKVIYNSKTKKYVLWYNWYPTLWEGQYGVAISDYPEGPFHIVNSGVSLSKKKTGDFNLLVDDNNTAYISYNTIIDHIIFIEKLNYDFTGSANEVSEEIDRNCEASAIFKRGKYYYLLTDKTCCFCGEGTGAKVYMSTMPLTGYKYISNINRFPGNIAYAANDNDRRSRSGALVSGNQSAEVVLNVKHTIQRLNFTVASSKYISHCRTPDNAPVVNGGEIFSNMRLPKFIIAWKDDSGKWKRLTPERLVEKNENLSFQTFYFEFPSIKTNGIRIQTEKLPDVEQVLLSEIEIYSDNKNIAAASENSIVLEVESDSIPRQSDNLPVIIPAQQTYVAKIPTAQGEIFMWMGDLWGSRPDYIKGHDFQYWYPLTFDSEGRIEQIKWIDDWKLKLK